MRAGESYPSINVTLLISFSVVTPSRALSSAESRRNSHAFFARSAANFGSRTFVKNHFANALGEVQQFVNRAAAAGIRCRRIRNIRALHKV